MKTSGAFNFSDLDIHGLQLENGADGFKRRRYDESLKAYLAPTGLVSEPRGDLTCRGDLRLEVPKTV